MEIVYLVFILLFVLFSIGMMGLYALYWKMDREIEELKAELERIKKTDSSE